MFTKPQTDTQPHASQAATCHQHVATFIHGVLRALSEQHTMDNILRHYTHHRSSRSSGRITDATTTRHLTP